MQKLRLLAPAFVLLACSTEPTTESEDAGPSASVARPLQKRFVNPTPGPLLPVLAGQGAGPIRFGASIAMVERLMEHPCEVKGNDFCRYVTRGIDFHFVGGILQWIYIQRAGRPAGKSADGTEDLEFGFFKGVIPPDLRLGMKPEAIREYLGKPYRAEKAPEPNPQNTVWLHYYPGMILEYDRWENGNLILGGIRVMRDPNAVLAAAADAGVSDAGTGLGALPDAGVPGSGPGMNTGMHRDGPPPHVADAGAKPIREPEPR